METLISLKNDLQDIWHLSKQERNRLIQRIQAYAAASDETAFIQEVRTTFPLQEDSGLADLYLALSESEDSERWSRFFIEEYQRAFELAQTHPNPGEVLECLDSIFFTASAEEQYMDEVIELIVAQLSSGKAVVRQYAIRMLGDWILKEDAARYTHMVQQVFRMMRQDDHWRVRLEAADFLEGIGRLPLDYQPRLWDRLRQRILGNY